MADNAGLINTTSGQIVQVPGVLVLDGGVWKLQATTGGGGGGVPSTRTINTTSPLQGGGDLSVDRTLSIPAATSTVNGYMTTAQVTSLAGKIDSSTKGVANGVASLDSGGKVPSAQLPTAPVTSVDSRTGAVTLSDLYDASGAAAAAQAASQPVNANLTAIAGQTTAADRLTYWTGLATAALATLTAFGRSFIAATDAAAAKLLLSLVKADVGLSNVDNTADATKSVLYATTAGSATDSTKLPLAGGNMTGNLTTSVGVKLGLGTSTPQYAIHAQATGEAQLYAGTGFTPALSSGSDPNLLFGYGGAGFRFGGAGTGLSYNQAQIDLTSSQTIRMYTGAGTVAPTERLQVTSAGQLQVLGAGGPSITSANTVVVRAPTYPYLHFVNNTSGGAAGDGFLVGIESTYANIYVAEAWDLRFATSAVERMRIAANGDVSITNTQSARTALTVTNSSANAAAEAGTAATTGAGTVFFGTGSSASSKVAGGMIYTADAIPLTMWTNGLRRLTVTGADGNVGIGVASGTAALHVKAGTATANTAPLKVNSGTLMSSAEAGAVEYDGTDWYMTDSTPTRRTVDYLPTVTSSATPVTVPAKGGFVRVVGAAGAKTVNLPALSGVKTGTRVIVKDSAGNAASGTITITPNGTDTIDGAASATITTNNGVVRLFATGSAGRWEVW